MVLEVLVAIIAQVEHVFDAQLLAVLIVLSYFRRYEREIVPFVYDIKASVSRLVYQPRVVYVASVVDACD